MDANRLAVQLNLAALHLATQDYGAALAACDAALALQPGSARALARRARAHIGRHELAAAEADLADLRHADPGGAEAHALEAALASARARGARQDRETAARMFERAAGRDGVASQPALALHSP